ncbi:MAG: SufD family Fe-S cluster assembly protein [Deltaproteobacteria bacterium]|nr:SufD family Fe-S cluster assembly protein [Deltaproteobacteria bacterium]
MSKIDEKARTALKKKSLYGPDIDLDCFRSEAVSHEYDPDLSNFSEGEKKHIEGVGFLTSHGERTGSFVMKDHSPVQCSIRQDGVELLSMNDALKKYYGLTDYWWKAVDIDADKYTAQAAVAFHDGYFIRARAGIKAEYPVQACLYISSEGIAQNVHNMVIAEEDSELHIITGCTTAPHLKKGLHVGVSEFYIKKGATVTFTMLHTWGEEIVVRPRTSVWVEEGATFMSNYVCMKMAKSVQMYPSVRLKGRNAVARINTILVAPKGSDLDIGGRVSLEAPGTKAEIISRAITRGGNIIARGLLIGQVADVKAHLECNGLILSEEGRIRAIPELDGWVAGVEMSHEAAVGKISQDEIEYLMSRGLSEDEATALIVRGFLNVKMEGLPKELQDEIERIVYETGSSVF